MEKTTQGHVDFTDDNGVRTIEFYHPSHNSLPSHLLSKLAETITTAGDDDKVILIVLKSAGDRTFCAGASFDELVAIEDKEQGLAFFMGFANVINAIRTCRKIVIGRVQGKAVGGGVGLASACDYCFATKYASIKLSELAVGIGPFVIGPAVERKIGLARFSQMAINAKEWYSAEWGKQAGIYQDVFESGESMDEHLKGFLETTVSMNPEAMTRLKKVFWDGTDDWAELLRERAMISGELILSPIAKETIKGFLKV